MDETLSFEMIRNNQSSKALRPVQIYFFYFEPALRPGNSKTTEGRVDGFQSVCLFHRPGDKDNMNTINQQCHEYSIRGRPFQPNVFQRRTNWNGRHVTKTSEILFIRRFFL